MDRLEPRVDAATERPEPQRAVRHGQLPWVAALSGLAVLLNALPLPLLFGIEVLFGSVPAILALLLWRSWWAVGIGVLASLQTWPLWGHPWAIVIFTLEMLWLWVGLRRFNGPPSQDANGRVVLFSLAYWLLLGSPLVYLFYGLIMQINPANVAVVAVKQSFNGVLNTVLAFSALLVIRSIQAQRGSGPGFSLRGVIIALVLLTITVPTLVISNGASQQLKLAVQEGVLDNLRTVNLAVAEPVTTNAANQRLIEQLGSGLAYRRINANGDVIGSDPTLFKRLDSGFSDGGRSQVLNPELAILIPRGEAPQLRKWVNGYWSYSSQYGAEGGLYLVQVVQPAKDVVVRMQGQSSRLLGGALTILVLGTLASNWVGNRFEKEFRSVLAPRDPEPGHITPLRLSPVSELRSMAELMNQRIRQVNQLSQELRQCSTTDPLTGCGNQQALQARLIEEWHRSRRSGEPLACLCLDVDGFTAFNDRNGSEAGDALLRGLAQAARTRLRVTDFIYRRGADEFVVIATNSKASDALKLAEMLQLAMAAVRLTKTNQAGEQIQLQASVSAGVTTLNPHDDCADSLLSAAEGALRQARGAGIGQLRLRTASV